MAVVGYGRFWLKQSCGCKQILADTRHWMTKIWSWRVLGNARLWRKQDCGQHNVFGSTQVFGSNTIVWLWNFLLLAIHSKGFGSKNKSLGLAHFLFLIAHTHTHAKLFAQSKDFGSDQSVLCQNLAKPRSERVKQGTWIEVQTIVFVALHGLWIAGLFSVYRFPVANRNPKPGKRNPKPGNRKPKPGNRKPKPDSRTKSLEPESENRKPNLETWNRKPIQEKKCWNPKPELDVCKRNPKTDRRWFCLFERIQKGVLLKGKRVSLWKSDNLFFIETKSVVFWRNTKGVRYERESLFMKTYPLQ